MKIPRLLLATGALAVLAVMAGPSHAADISGVWVTDAAVCDKVFARRGKAIVFTRNSDAFGSGFVIDGSTIRGKIARCRITAKKQDGAVTNLMASCSTDIALSDVHFALKMIDDDTMTRLYPGMEGMEVNYRRCPKM